MDELQRDKLRELVRLVVAARGYCPLTGTGAKQIGFDWIREFCKEHSLYFAMAQGTIDTGSDAYVIYEPFGVEAEGLYPKLR